MAELNGTMVGQVPLSVNLFSGLGRWKLGVGPWELAVGFSALGLRSSVLGPRSSPLGPGCGGSPPSIVCE
jgi:hypothetical protein